MKIVCYFAAADGAHPECSTADYDEIWPVMQQSVERHGYELIHLTGKEDRARCQTVVRYDIDPATVMFSREVAWLQFLRDLPDGEQACLVEPDCVLRKPIPPLLTGKDMLLLHRYKSNLPSGFRLATNKAVPYYEAVVDVYAKLPHQEKVIHGDVKVHHRLLGIGESGAQSPPTSWRNVQIEIRDWIDYTSKLWEEAVAWNFKGSSKWIMLEIARGGTPPTRTRENDQTKWYRDSRKIDRTIPKRTIQQ